MLGAPWKILVIDDDEDDFMLINLMLINAWKECVDVYWHNTPQGVIDRVCTGQFEATLIDSHLSGHTMGLELLQQIKLACPNALLIFLSDWPDRELMRQAIQKGANGALHKLDLTEDYLTNEITRLIAENGNGAHR